MLQWLWEYRYLSKIQFSFPLNICTQVFRVCENSTNFIFSLCIMPVKKIFFKELRPEYWSSLLTWTFLYTSCQQDFLKNFFVINKGLGLLQWIQEKKIKAHSLPWPKSTASQGNRWIRGQFYHSITNTTLAVYTCGLWIHLEGNLTQLQERMHDLSLKAYIDFSQ